MSPLQVGQVGHPDGVAPDPPEGNVFKLEQELILDKIKIIINQ